MTANCTKCTRNTATGFALEGELDWMVAKLVTLGVIAGEESHSMLELLRAESDSGGRRTRVFWLCQSCADELRIPTGEIQADADSDVPGLSQPHDEAGTSWQGAIDRARERQRPRKPSMAVAYSSEEFPDRKEAARAATKAAGCTCEPEIALSGDEVTIKHDHWCAVLRRKDTN